MSKPTYDPTPFPAPHEHVDGLIPGNDRPKAGKPSYEELEAICCGMEGERNGTKRRVINGELLKEYEAMRGTVVKAHGEIIVLCDFAEVTRHFGSS